MSQQSPPDPRSCTVLYKILTPSERESLPSDGWQGTELDRQDGFIHLSTSHQTPGTLQRFFAPSSGAGDRLVLLALPRANIANADGKLKFEAALDTEFGHIYGGLNPSTDFTEEYTLTRGDDGQFTLPELPF